MSAYRTILVAVDGSKAGARGLREAIRLARAVHAELVILHVINEFYAFATPGAGAAAVDVSAHGARQRRRTGGAHRAHAGVARASNVNVGMKTAASRTPCSRSLVGSSSSSS